MKKYILDIEANGLLKAEGRFREADQIWCIVVRDVNSEEVLTWTDHGYPGSLELADFDRWLCREPMTLIAHNGIHYDFPMLTKFLGCDFSKHNLIDTLIMSRLNNWPRKELGGRHSLKVWGQALSNHKDDFSDFSKYSDEMVDYCIQDCQVGLDVYNHLMKEFEMQVEKRPKYPSAMRLEHDCAMDIQHQIENGWLFDFTRCQELIDEITTEMKHMEDSIEPLLEPIVKLIDEEPKTVKYKKNGEYQAITARMLSEFLGETIYPADALKSEPPVEPGFTFQRKKVEPAGLGNQDSVKQYLETIGWKPTVWNWKKVNGEFIRMSAKLDEKDLKRCNHEHADMINRYYTLRSRRSILQGWMTQSDGDGRLRGDVMDLGAATGRHTHKVIANIPSPKAEYGSEIRKLFICPKDKVLVSADGASYQIRVLAHYLKSEEYMDICLNKDMHQYHADIMGVTRAEAKPIFFAVIFGAGAGKVASYLGVDQNEGKRVLNKLKGGIPGYKDLEDKAKRIAKQNGWIPGIDGRKIYTQGDDYKALNYLIQGTEATLMKATIVMINKRFKEHGIEAKQLLMYHDECTWEVNPEDKELASTIIRASFAEAPKQFGVDIMEAGDVNVGKDYLEVH